jgi:molybdopterin-containing oxidoreductase family iron-sulfur binding subunit
MSADDTPETDEPAHPYETEESFHPMGAEWEDQMRAELEETDYDADLGMEMARDAQRLVAGEITEEEFYAEYHDDVREEFDEDDRPVLDDIEGAEFDDLDSGGSVLESLADIDIESDDATRRQVMKKMGAGAAFLGYGAYAQYDQQQEIPEQVSGINPAGKDKREHRWGMVIDLERCDGCLACVSGCVDENGTSTGANWMYVMPYQNDDTEQQNFLVRPCQHCSNAPCAKVCPVRARHVRDKDGLVLTDYETCIGCRYCQVACPYGVNYFQWGEPDVPMEVYPHLDELDDGRPATPDNLQSLSKDERKRQLTEAKDHVYDNRGRWVDGRPPIGVMGKCTFCPTRQDGHSDRPKGTTACQDACDNQGMSAIHYGDLDSEDSRPNKYLKRRSKEGMEETDIHFQADLTFTVNDSDPIDVDDGYYPLHFVQQRDPDSSMDGTWNAIDSDDLIVTSGQTFEASDTFEPSAITGLQGVLPDETSVLSTDTSTLSADVTFDGDEFEDGSQRDVTASLRLVGAGEDTDIGETTVTLAQADADSGTISAPAEFSVDIPEEKETGVYMLYLLVEAEGEDGTVRRIADEHRVFVSDGRTQSDQPGPDYEESQLTGELQSVPAVVSKQETVDIEAMVEYPRRPQRHAMQIRLASGDGTDDDVIASKEFEFEQRNTSNTPWGGKQSSFKLLEDLGTQPNITYLGNEPGPTAEQNDGPVSYESIANNTLWSDYMTIVSERKEHLDYGALANDRTMEVGQ